MTKEAKIAIGVISALAVAGVITYFVFTRKPKAGTDLDWEDTQDGKLPQSGNTNGTKPPVEISPEQRKINNFNSVKNYFGNSAAVYNDKVVVKRSVKMLAQSVNQPATALGISNSDISVVYWKSGVFTVKIDGVKAAVKGYYYKGGTIIKVTSGKGKFSSKVGLREEDSNRLRALARAILR